MSQLSAPLAGVGLSNTEHNIMVRSQRAVVSFSGMFHLLDSFFADFPLFCSLNVFPILLSVSKFSN